MGKSAPGSVNVTKIDFEVGMLTENFEKGRALVHEVLEEFMKTRRYNKVKCKTLAKFLRMAFLPNKYYCCVGKIGYFATAFSLKRLGAMQCESLCL